jgi:NitT/TauT family transport system substrate-binding protein
VLSATTVLLLLGGCAATGGGVAGATLPSSGGPPLELTTLRVGTLPIVDTVAVQRAQEEGYFAAEGLTVHLLPVLGGASAVPQLTAGELDLSWSSWTSVVLTQQQGLGRFQIMDAGYTATSKSFQVVVLPSGSISEPYDLLGKRVAVNTLQSITELMGRSALQAAGVDPSGVEWVEVPFPNMIAALRNGEVDAAVMPEPFITQATGQLGAFSVLDAASGRAADLPIAGLAATAEFVARNPNTIAAFQRAVGRAQAEMADRAVVEQTLPSYTRIDLKTAARLNLGSWPERVDPAGLQRLADLMQEFGMLSTRFDVSPLFAASG